MRKPFIITGLPRSRTAWLATVCNTLPDVFCEHEPSQRVSRWQGIGYSLSLWSARPKTCGVSACVAGLHLDDLVKSTGARVVIVERPR